jgi:hypothetical protein
MNKQHINNKSEFYTVIYFRLLFKKNLAALNRKVENVSA